jgi:hypothetical protein
MNNTYILPPYFTISGQNLVYQGPRSHGPLTVSNFFPVLKTSKKCINSTGEIKDFLISFVLWIEGTVTEAEWVIPFRPGEYYDFRINCDTRCYNALGKDTERYLTQVIDYQISKCRQDSILYADTLGWTEYRNEHVYVAGDKVISKNGILSNADYFISKQMKEFHFDIDDSLSEREVASEVLRFMETDEYVTRILLSNTFIGLSRSLFIDAHVPPQFLIYLVGSSQYGKTTLACRTSSLYNRATDRQHALTSLISSPGALQKNIGLFKDTAYIVDDLCKDKNNTSMRQRENRLKDLIRIIGNNKEKEKLSGKELFGFSPNCTVVCTAEYLLDDAFSTLARCVVVHLDAQIDKKSTNSECKNDLVLPTAAYYFIHWCAVNYERIVAEIQHLNDDHQELILSIESHYMRLYDAKFVLETGMHLILEFCVDTGSITEVKATELQRSFSSALNSVLSRQKQELGAIKESSNYVDAVAALFKRKKIVLAEEGHYIFGEFDGVKREDTICIDGERLVALLCDSLGMKKISIQAVCKQFLQAGLLITDNSASNTKKVCNKRMLVIRKKSFCDYLSAESQII